MNRVDSGSKPPSSEHPCERSANLWFNDGNVVIRTKTKQYRVHQSVLGIHSSVFRDMFSIPQPDIQGTIDGCAIVDVTDSSEDWDALLVVMYGISNMFVQTRGVMPFEILRAMLVLGAKYDCKRYSAEAVLQLEKIFCQSLSDWDDTEKLREFYAGKEFDLLELVLSFGNKRMLPGAYYSCTSNRDTAQILREYRQERDRPLPFEVLDTLILAQQPMLSAIHDTLFKWCWDGTMPSKDCIQPGDCAEIVSETFRYTVTSLRHVNIVLEPLSDTCWTFIIMCAHCEALADTEHAEARLLAWDELPKFFGFKDWDSLDE